MCQNVRAKNRRPASGRPFFPLPARSSIAGFSLYRATSSAGPIELFRVRVAARRRFGRLIRAPLVDGE